MVLYFQRTHRPLQLNHQTGFFQSFNSKVPCFFCKGHLACSPTVSVSCSIPTVQKSPHTTTASPPVANKNSVASSAQIEEGLFQNRWSDFHLLSFFHIPEAVHSWNCSCNNAVSSTFLLGDQLPAAQTVILPSPSGFLRVTSTFNRTVTEQPLVTDAVITGQSPSMTTLPPKRRSDKNCPRLLRSNTISLKTTPVWTGERTRTRNDARRGFQWSIGWNNAV